VGLSFSPKASTREELSERLDRAAKEYLRGARGPQIRCEILALHKQLSESDNEERVAVPARVEPRPRRITQTDIAQAVTMAHAKFTELASINGAADACRLRLKQSTSADESFALLGAEYNQIQRQWDNAFREYCRLAANAVDLINLHVQRIATGR